jgi:two-component system, NarL family, response regulator DesR
VVRVLVVEELRLLRAAICSLLSQQDDFEVVGAVGVDPHAVATVASLRPDVALVDIDGENGEAMRAAAEVRRSSPESAILMITGRPTPGRVYTALATGPAGLLAKDTSAQQLFDGVRRVGRGERVIEPNLAVAALRAQENPLSRREQDVLRLAADGLPLAELAGQLCLSVGTVRNYLSSVITKTGARNRIDAIRLARHAGWL